MFSLVSGLYDSYLAPSQLNLLVVGAPNSGKTSLLERLKVTEIPKRPSKKAAALSYEELPASLIDALVDGGASVDVKGIAAAKELTPKTSKVTKAATVPNLPTAPVLTQKRRFPMICPAPERYRNSVADDDEEFVLDETEALAKTGIGAASVPADTDQQSGDGIDIGDVNVNVNDGAVSTDRPPVSPQAPRRVRCHSKEFNMTELDLINSDQPVGMEDVPLNDSQKNETKISDDTDKATDDAEEEILRFPILQESDQEYDLKAKGKMLPLSKIRPTIGTNLGKMDMCGAKCHFFDVGGRMKDLWERYYEDCDAVIFCWRVGDDPDGDNDGGSDDEDETKRLDLSEQQELLNEVRKEIPDEVPFLIFGHVFGNANEALVDTMYLTDVVLPHYHNPMTGFCCGSAKTGAGVRSAMEWLIPLAKRQQKERFLASKIQPPSEDKL